MDVRARILRATTDLLASGGRDAVSTRAVSTAAGVQAPTIYRQFGDMQGLLNAVAGEALSEYVRQKRVVERTGNPMEDLRRGWDHHIAFGLANPAVYLLVYSEPSSLADTPAKREGEAILLGLVTRLAEAGRLGVGVAHAARMITAACRGVALSLISTPAEKRDHRLSQDTREAVLYAVTISPSPGRLTDEAPGGVHRVAARAIALQAVLADAPGVLSSAEQFLLGEWLDRLAALR